MIKVMKCKICGQVSAPWFGFYKSCPYGTYGKHEQKEEIYITEEEASFLLKKAYNEVEYFDRRNFEERASEEYKRLLRL